MSNTKFKRGTEDIKCPFFRYMEKQVIGCEGITDRCIIRLVFNSSEDRVMQEQIFCSNNFEKCEIYRAVSEQYED